MTAAAGVAEGARDLHARATHQEPNLLEGAEQSARQKVVQTVARRSALGLLAMAAADGVAEGAHDLHGRVLDRNEHKEHFWRWGARGGQVMCGHSPVVGGLPNNALTWNAVLEQIRWDVVALAERELRNRHDVKHYLR